MCSLLLAHGDIILRAVCVCVWKTVCENRTVAAPKAEDLGQFQLHIKHYYTTTVIISSINQARLLLTYMQVRFKTSNQKNEGCLCLIRIPWHSHTHLPSFYYGYYDYYITAPWSKNLGKLNCPLQQPVGQWKVTLGELKSVFGQISLHQNLIFSKKLSNGVWVQACSDGPIESGLGT